MQRHISAVSTGSPFEVDINCGVINGMWVYKLDLGMGTFDVSKSQ